MIVVLIQFFKSWPFFKQLVQKSFFSCFPRESDNNVWLLVRPMSSSDYPTCLSPPTVHTSIFSSSRSAQSASKAYCWLMANWLPVWFGRLDRKLRKVEYQSACDNVQHRFESRHRGRWPQIAKRIHCEGKKKSKCPAMKTFLDVLLIKN